ncbi:MAG: NAD(P)/FAD-dependent oxidoreductase [Crocinitomicaceae bacterium]|nr:NAD(P)/FAD-dependent oxidoreductase [Crocinitomicaceae bacterium]
MKVVVVGGGAAGFFTAIQIKEMHPDLEVMILEKSKKLLSKVKVSGGGRCNVTNACETIDELASAYPRGGRHLRKLFGRFNNHHMMEWLESKGVECEVYPDNCVFPKVNDSQIIIDLFLKECSRLGIRIQTETGVVSFTSNESGYSLKLLNGGEIQTKYLVFALGGQPKESGLQWLKDLGYQIESPVPSLFTFNMPQEKTADLMGIVVENAIAKIEGEKLEGRGPLLFTHWGMSGPAILMLSAWGARILNEKNYEFKVRINWLDGEGEAYVRSQIQQKQAIDPKKSIKNQNPFQLPNRLWEFLLKKLEINPENKWAEIGSKSINKLINALTNDTYQVKGKTTFKEEFVTCGGVSLSNLNMKTMESKLHPGVFFIGEMIDIDGITGGYNFQACWTEAWTVANSIG